MRYFNVLDFQHWILAFFMGLLATIFVIVAWWRYPRSGAEQPLEKIHTAHEEPSRPIPPIVLFVIIGTLLGAVGYLIIVGIYGGAIS